MADTVTLPGTGAVIASDDIGGAQYQRVKLTIGADGTNDGDVASGNPLPVTGALTDTQLRATAVPVSGTFWQATQPVSGPLTDTQLRAAAVPVSAASLPLPTGAATEATLDARLGSLTETAPATDTASSGLSGRLQRIAQRLTSLIALLPASLGAKAPTASLSVVPAAGTLTSISGTLTTGGTAQDAAAANSGRTGWWIRNNHASASLWVSTLATAVQGQPSLEIRAGELYESPPGGAGTGAISVIGPTTGQPWTGREF